MSRYASRYGVLGVMSLLATSFWGCGRPVELPSGYSRWNAKDGTFSIDYPSNWKAEGGGKQGIQWAEFSSGGALIRVDTELSGGLVGDIVTGGGQFDPSQFEDDKRAEELAPVARVHEMKAEMMAAEMNAYKEEPAEKFDSQMGDARKSAFSASQGLGGSIRGYRATMLGHDKAIRVLCTCPAKNWDQLRPAFDQILASVGRGSPQS